MLVPDILGDGHVLESELESIRCFGTSLFNTSFEIIDTIILTNYMEYSYDRDKNMVVGFFKLPTIIVPFKKFISNRSSTALLVEDVTICLDFCNIANHQSFDKRTFLNYHIIESTPKIYFDNLLSYLNTDYRACIPHYIDYFSSIDKKYIINQCLIINSRKANLFFVNFKNGLHLKYNFNNPFPFGQFSYIYNDKKFISRRPTSFESISENFLTHYLNLNNENYDQFFKREENQLAYFFDHEEMITSLAEQFTC